MSAAQSALNAKNCLGVMSSWTEFKGKKQRQRGVCSDSTRRGRENRKMLSEDDKRSWNNVDKDMWRAVGWACDPKPHACNTTQKMHKNGEARIGGKLHKQLKCKMTPYNHTRWKHRWCWHNRGCVWDKMLSVFVTKAPCDNLGLVVLVSSRVDGCGPPTASPRTGPVYRGCPGRDPLGCSDARAGWHRRQSANPFCGCWSVLLSVSSCSGRGRGSRSNAIENTYTPARLEALFQLLVVILSHPRSYHS